MTEKQDLQQRRAALLIALDNTPGGAERVELQARISEIKARALIAARAKAAASWPHVAAFVPHLDAFIAAQEQHLADRRPEATPAAQDSGERQAPEAWQETWSS